MPRTAVVPLLALALLARPARAGLVCPQPVFDAGQQRTGVSLRHRFILVNRGAEAIRIVQVKPELTHAAIDCRLRACDRKSR